MVPEQILAIMPVHNRVATTLACIKQLKKIRVTRFVLRIVVIDDGSNDGTCQSIEKQYPEVKVIKSDGDLWWAGAVNVGLRYALKVNPEYIYLLNDDNVFEAETLVALYEEAKKDEKAICSSVTIDENTRRIVINAGTKYVGVAKAAKPYFSGHNQDDLPEVMYPDTMGSRSTLLPLQCIKDIGVFNSDKFPHNCSDFEYFARASKHGYCLKIVKRSKVYTTQNPNYFHNFLLNNSLSVIVRSYFNKKYNFYYKNLIYYPFSNRSLVEGLLPFLRVISVNLSWVLLRALLPREIFRKIIVRRFKIQITTDPSCSMSPPNTREN